MMKSGTRPTIGLAMLVGQRAAAFANPFGPDEPVAAHGDVARFGSFVDDPRFAHPSALLEAWQTARGPALVENAASVRVRRVDRFVEEVRPLCRSIERELNVPPRSAFAEVMLASEPTSTRPCIDRVGAFYCQLQGSMTWWLSAARVVRFPARAQPMDLPDGALRGVALPGTVVFVPAGVVYATLQDVGSFVLRIGVRRHAYSDLVLRRLRKRLEAIEELRAPMPEARSDRHRTAAHLTAVAVRRVVARLDREANTTRRPILVRSSA
jgi:ribosomal protein L16 Arg81 hydroxylase